MERKITQYLKSWKDKRNKLPLVIKGLRQVGKTYVVKEFAVDNYENAFLLDFRKDSSLHALFDNDFNIDSLSILISALPESNQLIKGSKMVPHKTVLVFDELQDCPNARSSLKYFKEDGRFDVICTGSLLGIDGYRITSKPSRGIAVGSEEQIEMYAMDFEEFLWAMNIDTSLIDILKKSIDEKKPVPEYLHHKFLDLINMYICIGGMPEVVNTFVETKDINESRAVQKRLLNNYRSDFGSHLKDDNKLEIDTIEKNRIMDVFDSIPKQLAKENKKFNYSIIDSKARARTHQDAINWLKNYGLIDVCYNLSTIEQPFDFVANKNEFKIYVSDIGLLVAMLEDDIPYKILSNQLKLGKGMIYENLIADALHKLNKPLYYFAKSSGLEIDFITSIFHTSYLVEVKSKDGNTKSAKAVLSSKSYNVDHLLKLSSQNISVNGNTFTAPYYSSFYILSQ